MIQLIYDSDRELFETALKFAQKQVRRLIETHPDTYPMYTESGKWHIEEEAWTHWCDGFLPGMMWVFCRYLAPDKPDFKYWTEQAMRYSRPLRERKNDEEVQDLGFLLLSTYHRWHSFTRDQSLKDVLIEGGRALARRFHEPGQYLHSFAAEDTISIDVMMNVGLVFYAAREGQDKRLRDLAVRHCLTTRRTLLRGDGSTAHEGVFDSETGEFLRQSTQQGFRSDSCWSRGLGWALYGFCTSYDYTRDPRFLHTSEACADYYITHTPAAGVPPWDYNAPPENRGLVDTSAAAITAAGLLRLCRRIPDPMKGHLYWSTAIHILRTLCAKYLASGDAEWEGVLKSGLYHIHKDLGVDESVIWGDYFFVEAIEEALRVLHP